MDEFKQGQNPKVAMGIGYAGIAKDWLASHNVSYTDMEFENEGTKDFKVVVYVGDGPVSICFDKDGTIAFPGYMEIRRNK